MDLFGRLFCLLITVSFKIDAVYIPTTEEYTYSQATKVCTLATPELNFTEDGLTPDLDMSFGTDVWLGYIEKMTPFEYFGCARKSDLGLDTADYITGDPGKCWSACNNVTAVAVYDNECFCLQEKVENLWLRLGCNKECPNQDKIVCGGVSRKGRKFVSLYKTTYTGPIMKSDSERNICLWYNKTASEFIWGKCTEKFAIVCYTDDDITLYEDNNGAWISMTKICFEEDEIPSDYNSTKLFHTTEVVKMWTGIIRSGAIYPITDGSMTGKYGYISITTGSVIFSHNDTMRKRALCLKDTTTPGQPTTESSDHTTTSDHTSDRQNEGTSDVGAIVGATVSITLFIIVLVVILVMWKRGIKLPFAQSKRKIDNDLKRTTNPTYNVSGLDNSTQGKGETTTSDYAEVDESKISPECIMMQDEHANMTNYSSDEPHAYITLKKVDKGPYDTTKTSSARHDQQTFNQYNTINLEESSNYDYIGKNGADTKTIGLENSYNTTTLATLNRHNSFTNNAINTKDESDDAYNHTDDQSRQTERNKSDNPYNLTTLGHLQNDRGVTNIAFNSNDECDDTYNHIGDQPGQNDQTITDNPYNTTTLGNSQTYGINNSAFNNNEDTYNHIDGQDPNIIPTFTDNDYATLK